MLLLTRRVGEELRIGDDVAVRVLAVRAGRVRLGVSAPMSVQVHRAEVYNRIKREAEERTLTLKESMPEM